jgi:GMP synthase-like glutamine amidotransferase
VDALVLQHIACEPPGAFADVMRDRGWSTVTCEIDETGSAPAAADFDAIVAMGGPMSVNDEQELPWLADEKRLIGDAVRAGTPYFGACLGVQLLAASLGARVYAGSTPEVGILPVELTDAGRVDPVLGGLEGQILTLQWHGDTFDLPLDGVLLAGSEAYPHQAFRYGQYAYGIQFHIEVSAEMAEEWARIPAYARSLEQTVGLHALDDMIAALRDERGTRMREHARELFARWCTLAEDASRE